MKNPEQGITMEHKSFNRIEFYQWMLILRRFEERAKAIYRTGMLQGALHLYIGEEAVAVGVCSVLRDDDYIFSTHRSHGHYLAKTHDVNGAMAELLGRATGCSPRARRQYAYVQQRQGLPGQQRYCGRGDSAGNGYGICKKISWGNFNRRRFFRRWRGKSGCSA